MKKMNLHVLIGLALLACTGLYSPAASAEASHACRLHNESYFAFVNVGNDNARDGDIEACDAAMPNFVRKNHEEETANTSGREILTHNPRDCIVVDPLN